MHGYVKIWEWSQLGGEMNFGCMMKCYYCVTSSSRRIPDWPHVSRSSSAWDQKFSSWSGSVPSWATVNLAMTNKGGFNTPPMLLLLQQSMSRQAPQVWAENTTNGAVQALVVKVWLGKEERKWDTLSGVAGHRDGDAMPGCDTHKGPRGLGGMGWGATLGLENGAHGTEPHLLSEIRPVGSVPALQTGNGETLQSTWSRETLAQKLCVSPQNRSYYYCFERAFIKWHSLVKIYFQMKPIEEILQLNTENACIYHY